MGVWRRARGGPEGAARPPNHVNSPCKRARVAGRGAAPAVALAWASTRACQPVRCPRWVAAQTSAGVCAAQTPAPAATVCGHAHVAVLRWFLFLFWTRRRGRRGGGGNLQKRPPPPWGALDPPGGHGRVPAGRSATRRSPAPCVAAGHRGSPAFAIKPLSAVVGARQTSRGCPSRAWRPPAHRRRLPMRCSQTRVTAARGLDGAPSARAAPVVCPKNGVAKPRRLVGRADAGVCPLAALHIDVARRGAAAVSYVPRDGGPASSTGPRGRGRAPAGRRRRARPGRSCAARGPRLFTTGERPRGGGRGLRDRPGSLSAIFR